jgi:hypothetical protein
MINSSRICNQKRGERKENDGGDEFNYDIL